MPSPVLAELSASLSTASMMGWTVTGYEYWRQARLPNTDEPANRTGFTAIVPEPFEQAARRLTDTLPGLALVDDDGYSAWYELDDDHAWNLVRYDDEVWGGYFGP